MPNMESAYQPSYNPDLVQTKPQAEQVESDALASEYDKMDKLTSGELDELEQALNGEIEQLQQTLRILYYVRSNRKYERRQ